MRRTGPLLVVLALCGLVPARAGELPRAKPDEVGLAADRLAELTPALKALVDDGKIPGGVALIARHGKVAYCEAFGYRDLESKEPMTEDTIFAIASMSKPITCVAVMSLVEQGKLGLDDRVAKYIPELEGLRVLGDPKDDQGETIATVAPATPVTIRHLLSHTSGLAYGFLMTDLRLRRTYMKAGAQATGHQDLAELMEKLSKVALAHQPGEGWTYGLSHDVLGRVVEVVSGQGFDRFLQERIFGPLDMRDTSFLVPESKRDRVATIYNAGLGIGRSKLSPMEKNYGSATFFSGGGGLFSTARDYARFAQMLLNGGELDGQRILKAETIDQMTTNQIGKRSAFGARYGLGFGLDLAPGKDGGEPTLRRYFWGGIFSTNFWVDPRHDLVAIVMTQVLPTNHGGTERVFQKAVDAAIID